MACARLDTADILEDGKNLKQVEEQRLSRVNCFSIRLCALVVDQKYFPLKWELTRFTSHFVSDDHNNIQSSLLVKKEIPEGKYASLTFNGGRTRNDIEKAIQILHKILRNKNIPIPTSSEYLFYFYNSSIHNVEPLLKTEVSILLDI